MTPLTPEAFASRFTAHARALWCIAVAILGRSSQAEDVLQEAALIALRKLHDFDPATSFPAWMGQIVRFVALNHARRSRRTLPLEPASLARLESEPELERPVRGGGQLDPDQASFDDQIVAALARLDETARSCLLLRTVVEMPYREIARVLAIPEGTAMSHVHRARQSLGRELAEHQTAGVTP